MKTFLAKILLAAMLVSHSKFFVAGFPKAEQDPGMTVVEDEDGVVDVFEFNIEQHDPTEVDQDIKRVLAEDWADTWDPPKEMKDFFPYYISGKDEDGAVGMKKHSPIFFIRK